MSKSSKKINVLFVLPDFLSGGAQKQCALLYSELVKDNDLEMHFLHIWDGPNKKWLNGEKNNVIKLNREKLSDLMIVYDIVQIVKSKKIQVVVSWLHPADTYCWLVKILLRNILWVMTERDSSYPDGWKYKLRKYFARHADVLLANSKKGCEYWEKNYQNKIDVRLVNNICAPYEIKNKSSHDRINNIVSLGRLEPQKNIIKLISVIKKWILNGGCNAVIGGSGSMSDYVKYEISSLQGASYGGYISDPMSIFEKSKVFISLSIHEGTPNSLIEAIVAGCVVVASKIDEHVAILGENYPFYVEINSETDEIVSILDKAIIFSGAGEYELCKVMKNAFDAINKMDGAYVASQYKNVFFEVAEKNA